MAWRCLISASEARYICIRLSVWKSKSSNSPKPLRRPSQPQVARSEPGRAKRPTIAPTAAARSGPFRPNSASNSTNPNCSSAHRPTCSTPTLRGRVNSTESTATVCRSSEEASPAVPVTSASPSSKRSAMRWASSSNGAEPSWIKGN